VEQVVTRQARLTSIATGGEKIMSLPAGRTILGSLVLAWGLMGAGCSNGNQGAAGPGSDPELATRGSIEVSARLEAIPEGAIFERKLYNYATVLKYQVLEVYRGSVKGQIIYVGHYNPFKPRSEAADKRVPKVGGNLKSFREGQVHHMALEGSMLEHFTGGILNKYSEEDTDPIYWAVWTDLDLVRS
jgi:hypothetical protein